METELSDAYSSVASDALAEPPTNRVTALAERVVGEYLRRWGLHDPRVIARYSQRCAQSALASQSESSLTEMDLAQIALARALNDISAWVEELSRLAATESTGTRYCHALVAAELPALLDAAPESFLNTDAIPEQFQSRLRSIDAAVVPEPWPTRMEGQPLGELPPVLQPRWWRRVWRSSFQHIASKPTPFKSQGLAD